MNEITRKERFMNYLTRYGHLLWIAGLVFLFITVCSTCSFIYPMNIWGDANIYFTVGKGMAHGKVLYRDIFDHKGPYIYMLHTLAYWISNRSFIGIYFVELALAFIFAYAEYRILLLYVEKKYALISLPVIMFASYAAYAFVYGDSAEELVLPFMAVSLLHILQFAKGEKLGLVKYGAAGVFTAWTLWIKFSLCGFYLGWAILVLIFELRDKNYKHLLAGIGVFFGALLVASVPVFIYFGVNGAFGDLWEVYFYDNLFVYTSGTDGAIVGFFKKIGRALWVFIRSFFYGLSFYILILPGFLYLVLSKDITRREKAIIFTVYGVMNFFIFAGGRGGKYYGLPVNIFSFIGVVALCKVKFTAKMWDKLFKKFYLVAGVATFVLTGLSIAVNPTKYMVFSPKSSLAQYKFAKIIEEHPSSNIINYGELDLGVHTTTGTVPDCKYFFKPNIALTEITDTQRELVEAGKVDYIVCIKPELLPDNVGENYTCLETVTQFCDNATLTYYLYGLNEHIKD